MYLIRNVKNSYFHERKKGVFMSYQYKILHINLPSKT